MVALASNAQAQNLFDTAIKVNDLSITQYEIDQRARMLSVFRAPGDPRKLAREQLIEDRLKLDAARAIGFELEQDQIEAGMEEFASRVNLSPPNSHKRLISKEWTQQRFEISSQQV